MLEKVLSRLAPHLALQGLAAVPGLERFSLQVDGAMDVTFSTLGHRQVLMESVVRELDGEEMATEDYLRRLLQRVAGGMRGSRSVLTIDPSKRCVVLFCTGNVEDMEGDRAVLWFQDFLNELDSLRRIPSKPTVWEMPFQFIRP